MKSYLKPKPLAAIALATVVVLYCATVWGPGVLRSSQSPAPTPDLPAAVGTPQAEPEPVPRIHSYIEVVDSCGPYFEGTCVNVRSGPGTEYPAVAKLRTGVVLKVEPAEGDSGWHRVIFEGGLRYPERVTDEWYVSAKYVRLLEDEGEQSLTDDTPATSKRIVVDRSDQMLYAYDGGELFMEEPISTGLELTPTPRGIFKVYYKTPSRYMQGPIPDISDQYYDLPGVPWNLYFTYQGAVIHGAYWHDRFGEAWSHGCVNLPPEKAQELYHWADVGTEVTVRD